MDGHPTWPGACVADAGVAAFPWAGPVGPTFSHPSPDVEGQQRHPHPRALSSRNDGHLTCAPSITGSPRPARVSHARPDGTRPCSRKEKRREGRHTGGNPLERPKRPRARTELWCEAYPTAYGRGAQCPRLRGSAIDVDLLQSVRGEGKSAACAAMPSATPNCRGGLQSSEMHANDWFN